MNKTIQQRVAELSATLNTISNPLTFSAHSEIWGEAEDFIGYNGRYDAYYGTTTDYAGTFNACVLQSIEEYQVIRFFGVDVYDSGECIHHFYQNEIEHEDEPDWMDNEEYEYDELEITGVTEYKQVWIDRQGNVEIISLSDINECVDENFECFARIDSLANFACEPHIKDIILSFVNEYTSFCYTDNEEPTLEFSLSKSAEYLRINEPVFYDVIVNNYIFKKAIDYYRSFRVAHRHKYAFPDNYRDAVMYLDYLKLLSLDDVVYLTQPYYICPADLAEAYAKIDERRIELLKAEEKRQAELKEEAFAEQHSWLFGIEFEDEHFHYKSLDSVEAYRIEGHIMHHCIYDCAYYEKPYYLSMHVSDLEGNRVATCTVDLLRRKINQLQPMCNDTGFFMTYGIHWQDTNDYKHIWNTLMARMHTFPKRKPQETEQQQIKVA